MNFGKLKEISGHAAGIYSLDFDGTFIYSASADQFVARWNFYDGVQDTFSIRFENPAYSLKLVDDHSKLAVGLANGHLHIFDLKERRELKFLIQHRKAIFALSENHIFNQIYAADADGNFSVWDSKSIELLAYLPFDCGKIRRIAVSSDGLRVALACQDGFVRILQADTLNLISAYDAHRDGVTSIVFHPDNPSILFTGGKDAYLKKWNLQSEVCLRSIPAHNYAIYDLITLAEGQILASASRDKTIKIWNSESLEIVQRLDFKLGGHRHSVNFLVALDQDAFVSASDDRKMVIWNISSN
jgi:WD40 repeat protein